MTPTLSRFLQLEKEKEQHKKYFADLQEATAALAAEIGINSYVQDPTDGTVFKLVIPEGKFITFEKISYIRTRRLHEKRGDLSIKEAEEAGYSVPTK